MGGWNKASGKGVGDLKKVTNEAKRVAIAKKTRPMRLGDEEERLREEE